MKVFVQRDFMQSSKTLPAVSHHPPGEGNKRLLFVLA